MKAKMNMVNARVENQRIDLRKQAVEKIAANAFCPSVVEPTAGREILKRRPKNSDFYSNCFRNSFFASSQPKISTRPAAKSASVFRSSSSCHAGLANAASSDARSPHSASIIFNFSSDGSLWSSAMLMRER